MIRPPGLESSAARHIFAPRYAPWTARLLVPETHRRPSQTHLYRSTEPLMLTSPSSLYSFLVRPCFLKWKLGFLVQKPQTVCVNTPRFAKVRQDKLLNFQTRFESGKVHAKEKQGGNTEREMHTRNWRRFMTELVLEASLD